jgi:hypothetical protein
MNQTFAQYIARTIEGAAAAAAFTRLSVRLDFDSNAESAMKLLAGGTKSDGYLHGFSKFMARMIQAGEHESIESVLDEVIADFRDALELAEADAE